MAANNDTPLEFRGLDLMRDYGKSQEQVGKLDSFFGG